jgi:hypothetical protein
MGRGDVDRSVQGFPGGLHSGLCLLISDLYIWKLRMGAWFTFKIKGECLHENEKDHSEVLKIIVVSLDK